MGAAATVEEITVNFTDENGVEKVRELTSMVVGKNGAWATVIHKFVKVKDDGELSEPVVSLRRYQKRDGEFHKKSSFNINSADQGKLICAAIEVLTEPEEVAVAA